MGLILEWFQNPDSVSRDGFLYAFGLAILGIAHSLLHQLEFFYSMRCGMHLRIAYIAAIYKKCLTLSTSHTSSTGLIVNLVSNDVQRFEDAAPFAHFIWLGPLEVVLMLYFMYQQISWAAFAAVGSLLCLIPLQGWFAKMFAQLRKKTVLLRDERIKSISDSLAGMLVVKLYAWEDAFERSINKIRDDELHNIRKASYLRAVNEAFFFCSGALIEIFAFITFWLMGGVFTPARIFTCIAYMSSIKLSMTNFFPKALQFLSESRVSLDRIQDFLALPDIQSHRDSEAAKAVLAEAGDDVDIVIKNGSFGWGAETPSQNDANQTVVAPEFIPADAVPLKDLAPATTSRTAILEDINLSLKKGSITAVVGAVGSGKSSLLNAILGEMNAYAGTQVAVRPPKIAFCTQQPYILSGTVRDNVTFGLPYDAAQFKKVIEVCAMDRDLEIFGNGELTVIGERGVTLSGGQRARLALARAVYSNADVFLMDDPLSAVDTKVGRHLFEECINGYLKDKTRVLVTHQLQFARLCDDVVILEGGKVAAKGNYLDVIEAKGSVFAAAMKEMEVAGGDDNDGEGVDDLVEKETKEVVIVEDATVGPKATTKDVIAAGAAPLIQKEEVQKGSVSLSVYWNFFRAGASALMFVLLLAFLVVGQSSLILTDYFLSKWSLKSPEDQRNTENVGIFLALAIGTLIVSIVRAELFFYFCLNATEKLFRKMLHSVYRSPMSFFQQNPHGRLMNRFSKDVNLADEMLPLTFFDFTQCSFIIAGTFIIAICIVPYVLIIIPVIGFVFVYLQKYYLRTSRQVKRHEATTRSPIYTTVPSTLEGLSTIRAFSCETRFVQEFVNIQNENTRMYFSFISSSRWLGLRLDLMSAVFLAIISFASVGLKGPAGNTIGLNSGTVGLLLTYSLQLVGTLQWAVRQSAEVENLMISVERVLEYSNLESEAPPKTDVVPPENWPTSGELEITNMSMSYPTVPGKKVLSDISVKIPGGMKIGVVGRTGAGKSSLLQVLFRLVEPTPADSIVLDNISTSKLGLFDLRSRISIIPQEPFCFKGTLRYNLDPFGVYQDAQLWSALESVELKGSVEQMADGLESPVAENGSNWSVGERQLICLARAILRNSRLIVLDEATSAVDMRTDALVQSAIRSSSGLFASSTVLCIAHRLQTIIDFDRVLVLDYGKVVEYGTPHELLQKNAEKDEDAWFARMVAQMGEDAQKQLRVAALEKWNETRHT
ncbi:P-loop containing nucleoside triphosphate hydrolase protein [Rhizoclosmatium globosum]|uniref:p-loop containing nucleoside triphosphate hydrolase protein n=1 Tax=Rhizoclosmatium globosum TaxID=329046 RepID=A0A1Y2D2U7_9FUNG|nr:P-loop containing nucleoside triphosphate hydrolase protein [Rhizoclosmatium globosum]|eukprot:ORY53612.1 P-loop containing nucleoside triphosphate hydrolase protein [Rhizoclosmatium globosum]